MSDRSRHDRPDPVTEPSASRAASEAAYRQRLLAPGPVGVPPQVLEALARPVIHHRSPEFKRLLLQVREQLSAVFRVGGEDVVLLTGSGTAAFEAAMLACVPAGGEVLSLVSGRFGERWSQLARRYGFAVSELRTAPGTEFDLEQLTEAIARLPRLAAVTVVHSETSTGMLHDVARIAGLIKRERPDVLLLVDAVTSLAVAELEPLEWGLDAVVSGSQKGVMSPPGLSFAWLSEQAWARDADLVPTGYLDLRREREKQRSGQTVSTPATSLVAGLAVALELILEQGVERRWSEKARLNTALLAGGVALGLSPLAERPSPALAALLTPEGIDAPAVVSALRDAGIYIAGGEGDLKPRLLRPSLLGWSDRHDLMALCAALETALGSVGASVPAGAATAAAAVALGGA